MEIPKAVLPHIKCSKDYVKGVNSPIVVQNVLPTKDWTPSLPNFEPQKYKFDTDECTQLSGINDIETQLNFLKPSFSPQALKWFSDNGYYDENGLFDCSERFTAILAGTSINGNTLWAFWQAARTYGVLPWKDLNYTLLESQNFATQEEMCADYYNPSVITQAMRDKALKAKQWIDIAYEYIIYQGVYQANEGDLEDDLAQCPIHIGVPVCDSDVWNSGSITGCSAERADHAILLYRKNNNLLYIRDQYQPMNKFIYPDYEIYTAIKGIVTMKPQNNTDWSYTFSQDIHYGNQSADVVALQKALNILGYVCPSTGIYDSGTRALVFQFQRDKVIKDVWSFISVWSGMGSIAGPLTRAVLNSYFS